MIDHSHLTENVRVGGVRAAYILDRKVVNEWRPNDRGYGVEVKRKGCTVGTPSRVNPKLREDVEYVREAFGREVVGWERHELRKC
jgi:hypothetical protein